MTDKEKIEKLLQHICKFEDGYDCDTLFGDAIYEDEGEWCENHCGENNLCEECFRHFLLGERGTDTMKDKKEIDYYEVLTELADCIQTSIELKKRTLEYLNPEFQKHEIEFEKKCIAKMEKQIEAIGHAINMIYS